MPAWIYPYLGAFLVGLSKAGFATGLGMLTTPLLATAVPARQAIGIVLPLLCFADLFTLSAFWKKWDFSRLRAPLAGSLFGIAGGMAFVNVISDHILRVSIGATALTLTVLLVVRNIWYPSHAYRPSLWEGALVGLAAGFSSTISHGAGPIIALFLMAQKPEKSVFVATNAAFFTLLNILKVPPYVWTGLINRGTLLQDLRYLPFIPLGVLAGWLANRALPQKAFEYLVYAMLFVTALDLLLT
jgi:uncharacterized membrane protein YfcA